MPEAGGSDDGAPTNCFTQGTAGSGRTLAWQREGPGVLGCPLEEGLLLLGEGKGQCYLSGARKKNREQSVEGGEGGSCVHTRNSWLTTPGMAASGWRELPLQEVFGLISVSVGHPAPGLQSTPVRRVFCIS